MASPPNVPVSSVDRKKELALNTIRKFEGIPPRALLATLAGIERHTLTRWEKDDEQFKEELKTLLEEKRLKAAKELYVGFDKCVKAGHYPAIKDGLKAVDPDTWGEAGEATRPPSPVYLIGIYKQTQILMQQTNGSNGTNGKTKEIEEEK